MEGSAVGKSAETEEENLSKFSKSYDDLVEPGPKCTYLLGEKGLWSQCLGRLPLIGYIFRWTEVRERRDSQPPDIVVKKPGMLTLRAIIDSTFLFWLGYLDAAPPEGDEFDPRPGCVTEYTNGGVLAALLLTVWYNFMTLEVTYDYQSVKTAYYISWMNAFVLTSLSTILSAVKILEINEIGTSSEARHFLKILDESTRGFGVHSPLIFLYFSVPFATFGLIFWVGITFNFSSTEFAAITFLVLLEFPIAAIFYFNAIGSLYVARHTQVKIQSYPAVKLTAVQIRKELNEFVSECGGFENIDSVDRFISHLAWKQRPEDEAILKGKPYKEVAYKHNLTETSLEIARETYKDMVKMSVESARGAW